MPRDPAATRQRIFEAASAEFAAHGLAGARVERIVAAAGVSKRMLYHYFGSKKALFREVLRHSLDEMGKVHENTPQKFGDLFAHWVETVSRDAYWFRLLMWQALETAPGEIDDEATRRSAWSPTINRIRQRQEAGDIDPSLDTEHLLLSSLAMIFFPAAFPQLTRLVTGHDPSSPEFVQRQTQFVYALVQALQQPPVGDHSE